jgi:hypothetical protein
VVTVKIVDQVKQCKTPQEALLVLAQAIDELSNTATAVDVWTAPLQWDLEAETFARPDNRARNVNGDIVVDPVSSVRQDERYDFATDQKLFSFYGPGLSEPDFLDAYVKGGPRWLYYTNRDAIMQMPMNLRAALVEDVLLDSHTEADEIGRDILKHDESMTEGAQVESQRARLGKP